MFIDEIKIYARAGHGGKGCVAFTREKYVPKGGPSGGNGGRGGDVILEADHDLNNLIQQFYNSRLIAKPGEGGMGKGMDGLAGKDLIRKAKTLVKVSAYGRFFLFRTDSLHSYGGFCQMIFSGDQYLPKARVGAWVGAWLRGMRI